jgi:hypothetical protein
MCLSLHLPPNESSEAQLDGDDDGYVDEANASDLSDPTSPPSNATEDKLSCRERRCQTQLPPPNETSEVQLNGDDADADADADKANTPGNSLGLSWEVRLSELAAYCKSHGHCNVPRKDSENTKLTKLGKWVANQRNQYKLKKSCMTPLRIKALESLGFEWGSLRVAWEDRLSELADYRKSHGHCNVPQQCSENTQLAWWVSSQRTQFRLHEEGKTSSMTALRIQALEGLGFQWDSRSTIWDDLLSELAAFRKIHGDCNVPYRYSKNKKLGEWVAHQRRQHRLHEEGKTSKLTPYRIQALESLGFEWDSHSAAWGNRLSELANYHKLHGHCNVSQHYSKNKKLGKWVAHQRNQYKLHLKEKTSFMTTHRIQALERLDFE